MKPESHSPRWGRSQESASEDPMLNGVFAREITRGLQEGEDPRFLLVAACLKHFAVYRFVALGLLWIFCGLHIVFISIFTSPFPLHFTPLTLAV